MDSFERELALHEAEWGSSPPDEDTIQDLPSANVHEPPNDLVADLFGLGGGELPDQEPAGGFRLPGSAMGSNLHLKAKSEINKRHYQKRKIKNLIKEGYSEEEAIEEIAQDQLNRGLFAAIARKEKSRLRSQKNRLKAKELKK